MLRNVKIVPVLNGWVVEVGCQKVVFNNIGTMLEEIRKYLTDPEEIEKTYRKSAVNARLLNEYTRMVEAEEITQA